MKDEYIIISKTVIQQRIEELKEGLMLSAKGTVAQGILLGSIAQLEQILSQSTPLIPEIEKAFDAGGVFCYNVNIDNKYEGDKETYISNLKLDI